MKVAHYKRVGLPAVVFGLLVGAGIWFQWREPPVAEPAAGTSTQRHPAKSPRNGEYQVREGQSARVDSTTGETLDDSDVSRRWQEIQDAGGSEREFVKFLRSIHRPDQFEAALKLISALGMGEWRETMIQALFSNPHVELGTLAEGVQQFPIKGERQLALIGLKNAFKGRNLEDLRPEVVASLGKDELGAVASGLAQEMSGPGARLGLDPHIFEQRIRVGIAFFDQMISVGGRNSNASELQLAKLQFLSSIVASAPETAFEAFNAMPTSGERADSTYSETSQRLVRSLMRTDPEGYIVKLLASNRGKDKGVVVAALDTWLQKDLKGAGDWIDREYERLDEIQKDEAAWALVHTAKRIGDKEGMNLWLEQIKDSELKSRVDAYAKH